MPLNADDLDELYSKSEAAELMHVSLRTINRMLERREIDYVRVGSGRGRVFITKRAILDHLNRGVVKAKSEKASA